MPNRGLRFYQAQADIFVDMLTYGFFGATAREAMMLGKPVVCYLRPEWLETMRAEIPDYVDELPVVSASPDSIRDVLVDLISDPEKRAEFGAPGSRVRRQVALGSCRGPPLRRDLLRLCSRATPSRGSAVESRERSRRRGR